MHALHICMVTPHCTKTLTFHLAPRSHWLAWGFLTWPFFLPPIWLVASLGCAWYRCCFVLLISPCEMALRGVALGDSKLKLFCAKRVRLARNVSFCSFGYGSATTTPLPLIVDWLQLSQLDFCASYIGGNDIANSATAKHVFVQRRVSSR